jgi:hypothetical protein
VTFNCTEGLDTRAGQAVYSRWTLQLYDLYVLGLSCRLAWRCPASALLPHYDAHVSSHHLDVGVGSGYFLDRCRFPVPRPAIVLLDLNEASHCLGAALVDVYNRKGIFSNRGDSASGLRAALDACFAEVSITVRGAVALFSARRPRASGATMKDA